MIESKYLCPTICFHPSLPSMSITVTKEIFEWNEMMKVIPEGSKKSRLHRPILRTPGRCGAHGGVFGSIRANSGVFVARAKPDASARIQGSVRSTRSTNNFHHTTRLGRPCLETLPPPYSINARRRSCIPTCPRSIHTISSPALCDSTNWN
jgi:hypothetical protein